MDPSSVTSETDPPKAEETVKSDSKTEEESSSSNPPAATETGPPPHVVQESWTKLTRDELVDKIKGVIYGHAIGDAIGLATEFMTKEQAKGTYGAKGPSGYKDIVPDFHRSRWDQGDWTDDTDQMLLILLSVVENNGIVDEKDFARRLRDWMLKGFPELGDPGGFGIGMTVSKVLHHPLILTDPHAAARDVWESSGRYLAANGAVMRTSILGVLHFNDLERVVSNTCAISRVTHADPRCTASCVAMTTAIALMLQGRYDLSKKDQMKALIEESTKAGIKHIELKAQEKEFQDHINAKNLKALKLGEQKAIGYTFKALGSGFLGLRTGTDFRKFIMELIMEAGDADTNGAVCGAMLGCKVGFSKLPQDLLEFVHRQWLDEKVDKFMELIGLK
ncbi:PREDICTED: uncharacterized protein LOC105316948 [Amphimedon queenslandica]|uniref:ADP-ribosylglycohydrolase n=1 Tax=Amphimedon queenslandica TaxID=400682 RepID=A0A1X7VCY9_AMPQE|nr:PREDICTED: uncharacterized protein LOC105316948 [Amphimedon queenslandica]|eukprot:XP_011410575.2 PREDICTED: uncharacterized protein LOC105316948 [Amphimedon queenslandica]